jgi:hypothetical protein
MIKVKQYRLIDIENIVDQVCDKNELLRLINYKDKIILTHESTHGRMIKMNELKYYYLDNRFKLIN